MNELSQTTIGPGETYTYNFVESLSTVSVLNFYNNLKKNLRDAAELQLGKIGESDTLALLVTSNLFVTLSNEVYLTDYKVTGNKGTVDGFHPLNKSEIRNLKPSIIDKVIRAFGSLPIIP